MLTFFASAPRGMEPLLEEELRNLGATGVAATVAGVSFRGNLETAYRACLWSRTASRILLPVATISAPTADALYLGIRDLPWEDHLSADGTLAVTFTASRRGGRIHHTQFGAQRVKDGVVDRFREIAGRRPWVDLEHPDLRINVHQDGDRAEVRLDLSGEALHRRGYRSAGGAAPLKENLAAAVLLRAAWPQVAAAGGPFLDPMCGSGTIPIEAALMAGDVAPGLNRPSFGFLRWPHHDASLWQVLLGEARERRQAGLRKMPPVMGSDVDAWAIRAARSHAAQAGLSDRIRFERRDLADVVPPGAAPGLLAVNPPYGERLGDETGLRPLYETLGRVLREGFRGWRAAVLTANPALVMRLGIRARRRHALYNGALKCTLFTFEVIPGRFMRPSQTAAATSNAPTAAVSVMLANRLRKNLKTIGGWARREGVNCYRLYDADLPEYAVALDVYTEKGTKDTWAVIQEYEAPKTVDRLKAAERLGEVLATVPEALGIPPARSILKVRRRQRGKAQYQKLGEAGVLHEVEEGGLSFLVNFTDYLDTGLFLDHRRTRALIRDQAGGKRFLNLFSYTGSATVYAAAGEASSTTSVDVSPTYLDWARQNLALNGFHGRKHELIQADCLQWMKGERRRWDLIFLDPPTFSSSKRAGGVLDVQRDHVPLIRAALELLAPGGVLIFSTNFRKFRPDYAALGDLHVEEITGMTMSRDFGRHRHVHACWRITA